MLWTAFQTASTSRLPLPGRVALFGTRVFADVIKLRGGQGESWSHVTEVFLSRGHACGATEVKIGMACGQNRSHPGRADSPARSQAGSADLALLASLLRSHPSGAIPSPGLDPDSGTVRTRGSVVKPPRLWGLFWQPQNTVTQVRKGQRS